MVANALECGECRNGDCAGLLKRHVVRFGRESVRARGRVFCERSLRDAEHGVTWRESGDVLADGLDDPSHFPSADWVLRGSHAVAGEPHRVRQPRHEVPDPALDSGSVHADQYLVGADLGSSDL